MLLPIFLQNENFWSTYYALLISNLKITQLLQENRSSKNALLFSPLKQWNILVLWVTAAHKQPRTEFCWQSCVEKLTDFTAPSA